jgi:hypothetical protein
MSGIQEPPDNYYLPDEDFRLMESLYIQTRKQERAEAEYLLNHAYQQRN